MLPGTVPEALGLLASDGAAIPIAGGTDLLVHWPIRGEAHDRTYVDLSRLDPLKALGWTADELMLGGLTTYWDVIRDGRAREEFPLLVHAARQVAASVAPTIRRCPAVEGLLETGTPIASPAALLPAIAQDVAPIDDIRSSAQYRTHVMARVLYHDLRDFWGKRA